jgi:hypothetical protein
MKLIFCLMLAGLGFVVADQLLAAGPKGQNAPVDEKEIEKETAKLVAQSYIEGQLFSVDTAEKKFTLHVTYKSMVLNTKVQQQVANLQNQLATALNNKRPDRNRIATLSNQIQDAESKLYDQVDGSVDIELKGTDKLRVRTLVEPTKENGAKLSAPELAAAAGNFGLPGYPAKVEDLEKDKTVRVYLDKSKLGVGKPKDDVYPVATIVLTKDGAKKPDVAKKPAK